MLQIKGLGAKKIRTAWEDLGVENATELLYACNENRLIELKGFGEKTQEEIRKQLEFFLSNRSNFLYANIEELAESLLRDLRSLEPNLRWEKTGDLRRQEPILDQLEYLMEHIDPWPDFGNLDGLIASEITESTWKGVIGEQTKVVIYRAGKHNFENSWLRTTGPISLLNLLIDTDYESEKVAFETLNSTYIPAECRTDRIGKRDLPERLIDDADIKGVIHTHTLFSDGVNSVDEMATYCKTKGYTYLALTDHSQIAVYADGMDEEKVRRQWAEIDRLNALDPDFRIIKGIECDILNDGDLDYDDELRKDFELVIASIHTNIKMDEDKATSRLIKAIEHPHTNMIGHPTGRLLLGRSGYPVDIKKVIDACAANQVAIEINASPYRLDLDWKHMAYAIDQGVLLSINPDAHAKEAIDQIRFGVIIARKGWLPENSCLNARDVRDFLLFCNK
jgi:DNA polymerase (family 10)